MDQTVHGLEQTLAAKGVKLFITIDHRGEAVNAVVQMPPSERLQAYARQPVFFGMALQIELQSAVAEIDLARMLPVVM